MRFRTSEEFEKYQTIVQHNSMSTRIEAAYHLYTLARHQNVKAGYSRLVSEEIARSVSCLFLFTYLFFLIFFVKVSGSTAEIKFEVPVTSFSLQIALGVNCLVTFFLVMWGCGHSKIKIDEAFLAKTIFECLDVQIQNRKWDDISPLIVTNPGLNAFFRERISSRNEPLRKVFLSIGVDGSEYWITNYFKWALQLSLSFDNKGKFDFDIEKVGDQSLFFDSSETEFKLRQTSFWCLILSPFLLTYHACKVIVKQFMYFKSDTSTFNDLDWSPYALIMLRRKLELPHEFRDRLSQNKEKAIKALKRVPKKTGLIVVAKVLSFTSSAILLSLVAMTALHPQNVENEFVVWSIAILSSLIAVTHSFQKTVDKRFISPQSTQKILKNLDIDNFEHLGHMIRHRFTGVLCEIISVLTTPFYLYFKVRPAVLEFNTYNVLGSSGLDTSQPSNYLEELGLESSLDFSDESKY